MKDSKDSIKPTVVLNRNTSDGFLDLNSSDELKEVIKSLNRLAKDR